MFLHTALLLLVQKVTTGMKIFGSSLQIVGVQASFSHHVDEGGVEGHPGGDAEREVLPDDALLRHSVVHGNHQEAVHWEEDGQDQAPVFVEGEEDASPQTFRLAGVLQRSWACSTSLCPSRIFPTGSENIPGGSKIFLPAALDSGGLSINVSPA